MNDYRFDPAYYKILDSLRDDGKPLFDVIGIQSHMHDGVWPLRKVWDICETYSKLGLPLHFTESTIVSGPRKGPGENWGATTAEGEARQAEQTVKFYSALFSHPGVQSRAIGGRGQKRRPMLTVRSKCALSTAPSASRPSCPVASL